MILLVSLITFVIGDDNAEEIFLVPFDGCGHRASLEHHLQGPWNAWSSDFFEAELRGRTSSSCCGRRARCMVEFRGSTQNSVLLKAFAVP